MNNTQNTLDARVINIALISEIEEKLIPAFQQTKHKTFVVNFSSEVAVHLFKHYHVDPQKQPDGFVMFVKSLRQRECFKDGNAWTKEQIISFLIDCMTEEVLQAKIGRPTDTLISNEEIHIDDMQTRWTHYSAFMDNNENYEFKLSDVKKALDYDKNENMNSLRDIRDELDSLVTFMENQTNPIPLNYDLLKQGDVLKENFDNTIFSCKLSLKPNSYLAKGFINDNMTATTLTTSQVLMTKGTVLPDEKYSWTGNVRPIIDKYNGRIDSSNADNPMFDGSKRKPYKYGGSAFASKAWILRGEKNIGQLSSLMMGQILVCQQKNGKLDLKKKLWEFDGLDFIPRSWRKVAHITDKPYGVWVAERFAEADLRYEQNRKAYVNKATKIVECVNDICYSFATDSKLLNQNDLFRKFFIKQYDNRVNDKDKHPTLDVLKNFSFTNVENAKLLISELVRNKFTYKIDILKDENGKQESRFIFEYLKTLNEVIRELYNTPAKVNKLTHLKSDRGDYARSYEVRLPVWKEIFELTEERMKTNSIFKSYYDKSNSVTKSNRDNLKDMFVDAWDRVGRKMEDDGLLYIDAEFGDVTLVNFHHGHTIAKNVGGSSKVPCSVMQHPKRNEVAGSSTQGDTTLPIPMKYYENQVNGLKNKLTLPGLSFDEKRRINGSIDVLEYIVDRYLNADPKSSYFNRPKGYGKI